MKPEVELLTVQQTVLLLDAEPWNLRLHLFHHLNASGALVGQGRLAFVRDRFAEHELVLMTRTERIAVQSDRLQVHVRVVTFRLTCRFVRIGKVKRVVSRRFSKLRKAN
jgi:hypothetical protein